MSVLSAIFAPFLTQRLLRPSPVPLSVPDYIMSIPFLPAFLLTISIVFRSFKTTWLELLLAQLPTALSSKFTSLSFNSATNQFKLATLVHPSLDNAGLNTCHIYYILTLHIASASLCLPQSPLPTSYQHCSCLSWFSTCLSGILSLIISDLSTLTLSSNPI